MRFRFSYCENGTGWIAAVWSGRRGVGVGRGGELQKSGREGTTIESLRKKPGAKNTAGAGDQSPVCSAGCERSAEQRGLMGEGCLETV